MERERLTAEMAFRDPDGGEPAPSIVIKIRRRLPDFARNIKLKYVKLGIRHGGSPTMALTDMFLSLTTDICFCCQPIKNVYV